MLTSTLVTSHRQVLPRNRIFTSTSFGGGFDNKKKGVMSYHGIRGPLTLGDKKIEERKVSNGCN